MIRCPKCEYLTNVYADLIHEDACWLKEYHVALEADDLQRVNRIGVALLGMEQFRREAKANMETHRAIHDANEVDLAASGEGTRLQQFSIGSLRIEEKP